MNTDKRKGNPENHIIKKKKKKKKKFLPVGMTTSFVIKCSLGLHWVRIQIKCCFKLDQSIFYLRNPSPWTQNLIYLHNSQKVNSAEKKNSYKNKFTYFMYKSKNYIMQRHVVTDPLGKIKQLDNTAF
jgi:hypothetical protein